MVGMTFLREREVYGSIYRADIIAWLVKHDAEKQFLVSFQDESVKKRSHESTQKRAANEWSKMKMMSYLSSIHWST